MYKICKKPFLLRGIIIVNNLKDDQLGEKYPHYWG